MTNNKIIRNYNIVNKDEYEEKHLKIPKVIKKANISKSDVSIKFEDKKQQIGKRETNQTQKNENGPALDLVTNEEGIIIGINVQCSCGEKISIKLEY